MIPLAIPNLTGNETAYVQECLDSTFISSVGPFVQRFERMVAEAAGTTVSVATPSGTTGLHLALTAVGVGWGDLVIIPSFTFIASANAVAHCGAVPWLLDVSAETWTLDPAALQDGLEAETEWRDGVRVHVPTGRRVAAIMPVHVLGHPADMDPIVEISRVFGVPVVADAAAALGADYKDRPIGALGADLSVFSFNGNKTVTTGGGGAVAGDDPELMERVRHLSSTARLGPDYDHDRIGFNYRMTALQAAVGCAQMERLDEFVTRKREIRRTYENALLSLPGLQPFAAPAHGRSAEWFTGVVLEPAVHGEISLVREKLRAMAVDARPFWKPVHLQAPYANAPKRRLDVTQAIWNRILTLPCSTGLTAAEQDRVIAAVRKVLA